MKKENNPLTNGDFENVGRIQGVIKGDSFSGATLRRLTQQAANHGGQAEEDLRKILETARSLQSIREILND